MNLLGTHVPVSGWTLAVLVVGSTLSAVFYRSVARTRRLRPRPTLTGLLALTVIVAFTLTPDGDGRPAGITTCLPDDLSDFVFNLFHSGGGLAGTALNLLLMLPLTASVVLACRRIRPGLTVAVALPVAVELAQTTLSGRYCTLSDLVNNAVGALIGVAIGWLGLCRCPATRRGDGGDKRVR